MIFIIIILENIFLVISSPKLISPHFPLEMVFNQLQMELFSFFSIGSLEKVKLESFDSVSYNSDNDANKDNCNEGTQFYNRQVTDFEVGFHAYYVKNEETVTGDEKDKLTNSVQLADPGLLRRVDHSWKQKSKHRQSEYDYNLVDERKFLF